MRDQPLPPISPTAPPKRIVSTSVRDLVEFVLRTGDLGSGGHFAGPNRALEGTRAHQRLQKARPAAYQPEVTVSATIETPEFQFDLKGRIDGVLVENESLLIEEIKTVSRLENVQPDPLHWAQARVYAHLYCAEHGFPSATVQLTYVELGSFQSLEFNESFTKESLAAFFEGVLSEYLEWLREHDNWIRARNRSIAGLEFPFVFRPGQRSMAVAVYRNIRARGRLFVEAPTGIGKTLSALFPTIKALGERHVEKIFYLTAKTVGRAIAERNLDELRRQGLKFRAVSITARDKICFNNGVPCDPSTCPFALGYYDRIKGALKEGLTSEVFTRPEIEGLARKHQVCPFELSLDLSVWADAVICDYNYAFDPFASLKRYFSSDRCDFALLVDEAHNLVDRARSMFSAELLKEEILALKSQIAGDLPACARVLRRLNARFLKFAREEGWERRGNVLLRGDLPDGVVALLRKFCEEAEAFLVLNQTASFRQELLDFYFQALAFLRLSESCNEQYRVLYCQDTGRFWLFCVDPSALLRDALAGLGSAVFFSATLRPIEYYRESLGGEPTDPLLVLDSPFSSRALRILLHHRVPTRLRDRESSYEEIAGCIAAMAGARHGNYLVYFPSYEYLRQVFERFSASYPGFDTKVQTSGMSEPDRDAFLHRFESQRERSFVAFAVLGGVFGEGIDLVGERLIGVAIIGVGLPQLCIERDLIREYWRARGRDGFDFAYTFPGMNRVLQAAGRVIRSKSDRGVVLLLDERFARHPYPLLFPAWWAPHRVKTPDQVTEEAAFFWATAGADRLRRGNRSS